MLVSAVKRNSCRLLTQRSLVSVRRYEFPFVEAQPPERKPQAGKGLFKCSVSKKA